jgi:hypothetical protein
MDLGGFQTFIGAIVPLPDLFGENMVGRFGQVLEQEVESAMGTNTGRNVSSRQIRGINGLYNRFDTLTISVSRRVALNLLSLPTRIWAFSKTFSSPRAVSGMSDLPV